MNNNEEAVYALKQLLEYAKYLEDNGQLTYGLLKARVETYEKGESKKMTREIKFRAWSDKYEQMYFYDPANRLNTFGSIALIDGDDHHVMQYTGLKDKDGTDIYEGDILKTDYYLHEKSIFKVGYLDWAASFEAIDKKGDGYKLSTMSFEVIGNVHENPELLSKGE